MRSPFSDFTIAFSIRQIAVLSIAGGLLSVSGFFILIPRSHGSRFFWIAAATSLLFLVLGYLISFHGETAIQSGIANGRWPVEDVSWLQAITLSPYLTGIILVLLVAAISLMFLRTHAHFHSVFWPFLILSQTLTRLATVSKNPSTERPARLAPHSLSPLRSDHWAER